MSGLECRGESESPITCPISLNTHLSPYPVLGSWCPAANRSEWGADKKKIKELERDISRKDRALAETTALLVLKKKADLIWGSGENE